MKKIVTVGGGTGSYTVLSGLKYIKDTEITALVSMADDGGSTGVLRDELGVLPPGDVRQCLVALSEHSDIVRKLMSYRFHEGSLSGHSFGNIFLAALEKVSGDFVKGVEIASEILKVKGTVVPVTSNIAELVVTLCDGTTLLGENVINHANVEEKGIRSIGYKDPVSLNTRAKEAILTADCIILGPGNYYCSILPNLIVDGFKEAIMESKAKIIFPVNLTNKQGHTMHWGVGKYVAHIEEYIGRKVDYVLINNERPSEDQIELYKLQEGDGVLVLDDYMEANGVRAPLLSKTLVLPKEGDTLSSVRSFIRHSARQTAKAIMEILEPSFAGVTMVFDFDDVVFNAKKFKERIFGILDEHGYKGSRDMYYSFRKTEEPFSLRFFLKNQIGISSEKETEEMYQEIMSHCQYLVNAEIFSLIDKVGKDNCYIVTHGDEEFQKDKIKMSIGDDVVKEVFIVPGKKSEVIQMICEKHPHNKVIFVDDKPLFINDVRNKEIANLKTILFDEDGYKGLMEEIQEGI